MFRGLMIFGGGHLPQRFLPELRGLWFSELCFEALSPFFWLLCQVNSNGSLDWVKMNWSLEILESCSRFKATGGVEKATNGCIARQAMAGRRENFWLRLPCGKQMLDNIYFNVKTHQPSSPCSICVSFWTRNWQLEKVIRKCSVYIPALATAAKLPISYSAQAFCLLSQILLASSQVLLKLCIRKGISGATTLFKG